MPAEELSPLPKGFALHQLVVENLLFSRPSYAGSGFKAAMREIGFIVSFVPDAYEIDREHRIITLAEVEITHQIDNAKAAGMARLYRQLGDGGWKLEVEIFGIGPRGTPVDMPELVRLVDVLPKPKNPKGRFGVPLPEDILKACAARMPRLNAEFVP